MAYTPNPTYAAGAIIDAAGAGVHDAETALASYTDAALVDPDSYVDAVATMPRRSATATTVTAPSGSGRLGYFTAQEDLTITQIELWLGGTPAAATPTLVRAGLYWIAANGDGTLVAAAADFETWLSGTVNTPVARPLVSPSSYAIVASNRYALMALVVTAAAAPTLRGHTGNQAADFGRAPRIGGVISSLADLPSPFVAADVTDSTSIPYITALA